MLNIPFQVCHGMTAQHETPEQKELRKARQYQLSGSRGLGLKISYLDKYDAIDPIPEEKLEQLSQDIPEYWATLDSFYELYRTNNLPYAKLYERVLKQRNESIPDYFNAVTTELLRRYLKLSDEERQNTWHNTRLQDLQNEHARQQKRTSAYRPEEEEEDLQRALEESQHLQEQEEERAAREELELQEAIRQSQQEEADRKKAQEEERIRKLEEERRHQEEEDLQRALEESQHLQEKEKERATREEQKLQEAIRQSQQEEAHRKEAEREAGAGPSTAPGRLETEQKTFVKEQEERPQTPLTWQQIAELSEEEQMRLLEEMSKKETQTLGSDEAKEVQTIKLTKTQSDDVSCGFRDAFFAYALDVLYKENKEFNTYNLEKVLERTEYEKAIQECVATRRMASYSDFDHYMKLRKIPVSQLYTLAYNKNLNRVYFPYREPSDDLKEKLHNNEINHPIHFICNHGATHWFLITVVKNPQDAYPTIYYIDSLNRDINTQALPFLKYISNKFGIPDIVTTKEPALEIDTTHDVTQAKRPSVGKSQKRRN